jgi:hypothetical protein
MAKCRNCGDEIDWAICDGRWVPLEPLTSHDAVAISLSYVDAEGVLRADHRERCEGNVPIVVTRLKHKVRSPHLPPAD